MVDVCIDHNAERRGEYGPNVEGATRASHRRSYAMGWNRNIPLLITFVAATMFVWVARSGSAIEPQTASVTSALAVASTGNISPKLDAVFTGVGSCAASNCHGGSPSNGIAGAEYSIWVQRDKHSEGYSVLLNDESKQMAKLLRLETEAHEASLCLNCHSPQRFEPKPGGEKQHGHLLGGVSCEACHGGAQGWLAEHVRWTDSTPIEDKQRVGFVDTDDLWERARVCADCHVGAPGRDVNHDLYAAGHPRLFFEFSAFMANMPIHWEVDSSREQADWSERPGIEASTWAVGQLATAEAALDLLIYRAERSDTQKDFKFTGEYPSAQVPPVWPEYAETGCFACHHKLASPGWRQERGYKGRGPGQYPWGTWTFPLVDIVTKQSLQRDVKSGNHSVTAMQSLMAASSPSASDVVTRGRELQQFLLEAGRDFPRIQNGAGRNEVRLSLEDVATFRKAVADASDGVVKENWDGATQVYLALAALQRAHRDLRELPVSDPNDPVLKSLIELRKTLEFPSERDSPEDYSTTPIQTIEDTLNRIRTSLD